MSHHFPSGLSEGVCLCISGQGLGETKKTLGMGELLWECLCVGMCLVVEGVGTEVGRGFM